MSTNKKLHSTNMRNIMVAEMKSVKNTNDHFKEINKKLASTIQ